MSIHNAGWSVSLGHFGASPTVQTSEGLDDYGSRLILKSKFLSKIISHIFTSNTLTSDELY